MIDAGSVGAITSSLKAAGDIAKAMIGLRDGEMLRSKTIELQGVILDAQSSAISAYQERSELVQRVSALEAEVARLKAWDAEKQRYELKELKHGAFARVLKESERNSEPPHALCPTCYDNGKKSVLQHNMEPQIMKQAWKCQQCRTEVRASYMALKEPQ